MINNISILTEEQLDEAVDELVEHLISYSDIYEYEAGDIDVNFVIHAADEIGVNPTPQVVDVALYRFQAIISG